MEKDTETIYGKFTQAGPVTEVKPSADEEARMRKSGDLLFAESFGYELKKQY